MNKVEKEYLEIALEQQFTSEEWTERQRHILTLRNFATASFAAGEALAHIRDKHLYRPYKNLREFCERECGWTKQRAYQLINAAQIRAALPASSQPRLTTERQARELGKAPEHQHVEILKQAEKSGKVTAQSIASAASDLHEQTKPSASKLDVDKMGYPIPKNALPYWNRRSEAKMLFDQIETLHKQIKDLPPEDPMWCEVNLNGVLADLYNAITRFKAAIPDYVCVYCQGLNTGGCTTCKGRGVVSEYYWKTFVPLELKMTRENLCQRITKT